MELAVIVPPGAEELVPEEYLMMGFADIAFRDPTYARAYARRDRVIMDNQIYEGEEGLPPEELAFILGFVQPQVAIVPDVRGDGAKTVERAKYYLPHLKSVQSLGVKLCGVAQGSDLRDLHACVDFMIGADHIDWMAFPIKPGYGPQRADTFAYHRLRVNKPVHFLGMEEYQPFVRRPVPDQWSLVESLDTAEPTVATIYGVRMDELGLDSYADAQAHPLLKRPPDFMTWQGYVDILKKRKELLWRNLEWMNKLLEFHWISPDPDATEPESAVEGTQPME